MRFFGVFSRVIRGLSPVRLLEIVPIWFRGAPCRVATLEFSRAFQGPEIALRTCRRVATIEPNARRVVFSRRYATKLYLVHSDGALKLQGPAKFGYRYATGRISLVLAHSPKLNH